MNLRSSGDCDSSPTREWLNVQLIKTFFITIKERNCKYYLVNKKKVPFLYLFTKISSGDISYIQDCYMQTLCARMPTEEVAAFISYEFFFIC